MKGSGREFRPRLCGGDALIIGWHEGADEAGPVIKGSMPLVSRARSAGNLKGELDRKMNHAS